MKSYLDLLNKLIAFGPKIIEAWPLILEIVALVQKIAEKFAPTVTDGGLNFEAPTVAEQEAEESLGLALSADGTQAIIDFGTLRNLWSVLKAYPELVVVLNAALDFLLTRFGKAG